MLSRGFSAGFQMRFGVELGKVSKASFVPETRARHDGWRIPAAGAILAFILSVALASTAAAQLTPAQANLILQGFQVFNTQTFNGNGRTCTTCHIPEDDYTISPADIAGLAKPAHDVALGGTNATLENQTLVDTFGLFNISNTTPGAPGTGDTPAGPFRASMQLSGLALTTLNDCPNATLISNATEATDVTDSSQQTAQITTVGPPIFPFEVGEPIDIDGVSINGFIAAPGGGGFFPGYNGIGVFQISAVINPTTFQYKSFGAPVANPLLGDGSGGAVDALLAVNGAPVPGAGVCSSSALQNLATFPVNTGTRSIELGWAGDGAPNDDTLFTPSGTTDFNCKAAVDAANANPRNLTAVLEAFATGAVRHHFALTNYRVPGVDFRCPTPTELTELAQFQEYLGRQFPSGTPLEFALKAGTKFPGTQVSWSQPVITFNDAAAELGKTIFLDPNAGCQFCHFNGGASLSASDIRTEPFGNPPLPFPGRNEDEQQNVDLLTSFTFEVPSIGMTLTGGLDGQTPVTIGPDPGDGSPIEGTFVGNPNVFFPATTVIPIFNVQSIIEAPRKRSFFHNGAFNTLEDAISFYFTDAFVADLDSAAFTNNSAPPSGTPLPNALGIPNPPGLPRATGNPEANPSGGAALALETLAQEYFSCNTFTPDALTSQCGQDVLNHIGFFLRALNVVYSIADCERLMLDASSLASFNQPTTVQVLNCTTDLNDVTRVINGARVKVPGQYNEVAWEAQYLVGSLATVQGGAQFQGILRTLESMRHSLARISPDLPD